MIVPRPRPGPSASVRPLAEIDGALWDDLVARARAPHPHYGRHAIEAHRAAGMLPTGLHAVTVPGTGARPRLDALLPFRLRRDLTGLGGLVARPFLSPLVTATAPLCADPDALDGLVAGMASASGGRAWRLPLLPVAHPAAAGMLAAMARAGWDVAEVSTFDRPVHDRRGGHDAFLAGHPHRGRLKDLRRRARRLGETGAATFVTAERGPALAAAVDAFLALERAGWKGAAGTAMACRPETARLARALFADAPGPVRVRADTLLLDGRPIAVSLALVAGGVATLLKTAYDESQRAHAPGLLLEAEILRACEESAFAERLDSATLAGSALESLYRERERVAEVVAVPPGAAALSLDRRVRLARFEARAREAAKRALRRTG